MTIASEIYPRVRSLVNDTRASGYRNSDDDLLQWVMDCFDVMVDLRPDLFNELVEHACSLGAEQTLAVERVRAFQEVLRVKNGPVVLPGDKASLDLFNPNWILADPATAVNWMPHPESPAKFFVDPPAPEGQVLIVRSVRALPPLVHEDAFPLPDNYIPAVVAFCVNRVESKDDENVLSERAASFMSDFVGMIGAKTNTSGAAK